MRTKKRKTKKKQKRKKGYTGVPVARICMAMQMMHLIPCRTWHSEYMVFGRVNIMAILQNRILFVRLEDQKSNCR